MKTQKQRQMVQEFLSKLPEDDRNIYQEIILYLSELGYNPKKEKSSISFKHDAHNKQIAKMSLPRNATQSGYFALRFSACTGYSQRFTDIVRNAITKYPTRTAGCLDGNCSFCAGEPQTHVYKHTYPDGRSAVHCGAYALEIPNIAAQDIPEIKSLIDEENIYLLKHQAGIEAI